MRRAFTVSGFKRLHGGTAASMVGDSLMLIVMSMWVKTSPAPTAQPASPSCS